MEMPFIDHWYDWCIIKKINKRWWKRELRKNYKLDYHKFRHEIIPVATFVFIS